MQVNTIGSCGVYIRGDWGNGITELDFKQFESFVFNRKNINMIGAGGGTIKKKRFGLINYNKFVNIVDIHFVKPIILRHIDHML